MNSICSYICLNVNSECVFISATARGSPGLADELERPEDGCPGGLVRGAVVHPLQPRSLVRQQQLGRHQRVQVGEAVRHLRRGGHSNNIYSLQSTLPTPCIMHNLHTMRTRGEHNMCATRVVTSSFISILYLARFLSGLKACLWIFSSMSGRGSVTF